MSKKAGKKEKKQRQQSKKALLAQAINQLYSELYTR